METKRWYQSFTVWAGALMLLNCIGLVGINIDFQTGDFNGNIYDLWASIGGMVTGAATIYGRIRAAHFIKPRKKKR